MKTLKIPNFDLDQEAYAKCGLCKTKVPIDLNFIKPIFVADRYVDLCPECHRKVNKALVGKLPEVGGDLYFKFISWKEQQ